MAGADIAIGWVKNGEASLFDYHSVTTARPTLDEQQDVELVAGREEQGYTLLTFRRRLDTCDDQDVAIKDGTSRVIVALGADDPADAASPTYHGQDNRVSVSLQLLAPGPAALPRLPDDSFSMEFTHKNFSVPSDRTTYWCQMIKAPEFTKKHHVVMYEPIITEGHENNVHHMIVYACYNNVAQNLWGSSFGCYVNSPPMDALSCNSPMWIWAIGGGPIHYPEQVGWPLGHSATPIGFRLEIHYDNPAQATDLLDSSGMRLWLTPALREFDGGTFELGSTVHVGNTYQIYIPPHYQSLNNIGQCHSDCLQQGFEGTESVRVIGGMLHSHLLGHRLVARHVRGDQELEPFLREDYYDFDFQEYIFYQQERQLLPTDHVIIECDYDSSGRTNLTYGGFSTYEEMCLGYLLYYPAVNVSRCQSRPTRQQLVSFLGLDVYFSQTGEFKISTPGPYQNMTVDQALASQDWNNATLRQLYQAAISSGPTDVRCDHSGTDYPVDGQVRDIVTIDNEWVEQRDCPPNATLSPTTPDMGNNNAYRPHITLIKAFSFIVAFLVMRAL